MTQTKMKVENNTTTIQKKHGVKKTQLHFWFWIEFCRVIFCASKTVFLQVGLSTKEETAIKKTELL